MFVANCKVSALRPRAQVHAHRQKVNTLEGVTRAGKSCVNTTQIVDVTHSERNNCDLFSSCI